MNTQSCRLYLQNRSPSYFPISLRVSSSPATIISPRECQSPETDTWWYHLQWLFHSTPAAACAHTKVKVACTTPLSKSSTSLQWASEYHPNPHGTWLCRSLTGTSHCTLAGPSCQPFLQWAKFFSISLTSLLLLALKKSFHLPTHPSHPLGLCSNMTSSRGLSKLTL